MEGLHGYTRAHQVALDDLAPMDGADPLEERKRAARAEYQRPTVSALASAFIEAGGEPEERKDPA